MPLFIIYLLVVIAFAFDAFSTLSRGSLFNEVVKFIIFISAILILILMCIFVTIWYSWPHILGLIVASLLSFWIIGTIFRITIFKNIP